MSEVVGRIVAGAAIGLLLVELIEAIVISRQPGDTVLSLLRRILLQVSLLVFATGLGIVAASVAAGRAVFPGALPISAALVVVGVVGTLRCWKRS